MAISFWKSILQYLRLKPAAVHTAVENNRGIKRFQDQQQAEAAFDSRRRGVRTVALKQIVGSVGRYHDFDNRFRMRTDSSSERLQAIRRRLVQGQVLPPVKLFQIKDEYYVLDGNHRVAAAKDLDHDEILADIVEFIPSNTSLNNLLYRQRAAFSDRVGLSVEIQLTEVGQYDHLLDQIQQHQRYLQKTAGQTVAFQDAAQDWHKTIFRPFCAILKRTGLLKAFPERTMADLYAYVSLHQWKTGRRRDYGSSIRRQLLDDMEAFREKMANLKECDYPEMQRGITAFVLMNVQAKRERKIVEKLFELEEVQEVHSVHGDVDLLVKFVLTRDLLSSDAEVISQFVHNNVRQLTGVQNTKTLIPGLSRIKSV